MRFLLVLLCACRFSWSPHQGAPPRTSNNFTLALYANDETAMTMARSELQRDPHVTIVAFDASVLDLKKVECGTPACRPAIELACAWAAQQGIEYYAIADVTASFASHFECTHYSSSLLDKHDECAEGKVTDERTNAVYSLTVYDVKTCQEARALSKRITSMAPGPEEQSKPEAIANLAQKVPAKSEGIPEQARIGAFGRVEGDPPDGDYALFRDGEYAGYVRVRGREATPMYCCKTPDAGDVLVARGRRKFIDVAIDAAFVRFRESVGFGAGAHLRHYALDGGLQLGIGTEALINSKADWLTLRTVEIGWGLPVAPGFVASLNLGVGWAKLVDDGAGENGTSVSDTSWHLMPTARLQTFLTTFLYVTFDVSVAFTGAFDAPNLNGKGVRAPIARFYLGVDI